MSEVWVLSEGVQVEGMAIVGVFSSQDMAVACGQGLLRRSRPIDYELQIDRMTIDKAALTSSSYHLKHPWETWT